MAERLERGYRCDGAPDGRERRAVIECHLAIAHGDPKVAPQRVEIGRIGFRAHLLIELGEDRHARRLVGNAENALDGLILPVLLVIAARVENAAQGLLQADLVAGPLADLDSANRQKMAPPQ
jgi:hypothetical protein